MGPGPILARRGGGGFAMAKEAILSLSIGAAELRHAGDLEIFPSVPHAAASYVFRLLRLRCGDRFYVLRQTSLFF